MGKRVERQREAKDKEQRETTTPPTVKDSLVPEVTNIAGTGGVTRSGRIFALESLQNKALVHAKKDSIKSTKEDRDRRGSHGIP
ncbi:hypothetical protein CR513_43487, partial [Mucuna pruriens]